MVITFDSGMAHRIGLNAAVIYGALQAAGGKEILCTVGILQNWTTLSVVVQLKAIKRLVELGRIEVVYAGLPRKRYIRILDIK